MLKAHQYSAPNYLVHNRIGKSAMSALHETSISFKGKDFCLKNISGLPCPCCGRQMKKFQELENVVNKIMELTGIDLIRYIGEIKDWLPQKEGRLLTLIQRKAVKNNGDNFFDLLVKIKDDIHQRNKDNSFIIKLANQATDLTSKEKIGVLERLFDSCRMTEEHIVPKCHGGQDNCLNIMLECKFCNTQKGNKFLPYQIKKHPSMIYTLQHYFNTIFKKIENKEIPEECVYELSQNKYFENIKNLLQRESEGQLDIDISRFTNRK